MARSNHSAVGRAPASVRNSTGRLEPLALAAIVLSFILAPLGPTANAIATGMLVLLAVCFVLARPSSARTALPKALCVVILLGLVVGLSNPNIYQIETGVLGLRKSGTILLALIIGLSWANNRRHPATVLWSLLVVSCATSLLMHLVFGDLELALQRGAGEATGSFDGEPRLQGIFAGPFHPAMASAFVILAALPRSGLEVPRFFRFAGAVVGAWTLLETEVRTGLVAVALGLILYLLTTSSASLYLRIILATPLVSTLLIMAAPLLPTSFGGFAALQSLLTNPFDSRFAYRYVTWDQALQMISTRPLIGWGPGSAGDTMGPLFPAGGHVTSHNMFLKYAVEGGLPLAVLFGLLVIVLGILVARGKSKRLGLQALLVLVVFGATGSSVEAVPVVIVLGTIIGISASDNDEGQPLGTEDTNIQTQRNSKLAFN